MKLKKFALRGLVILMVVVALCIFFARTVQTITTPKVQLVSPQTGRLEIKMNFQGQVYFPETEEFVVKEGAKTTAKIKAVYVSEGHWVNEGDIIFTTECTTYDDDMKKLQEQYNEKNKSLLDLDVENKSVSKESRRNDLYDAMLDAQDELARQTTETRVLALNNGITLTGDVADWSKQLAAQTGEVPQEVKDAVDKTLAASSAFQTAQDAYFAILEDRKLKVKDDVFKYINDRNALIKELDDLTAQMVELTLCVNALSEVRAPRDGFIVSVKVTAGDTYDGVQVAYEMNKEGVLPVLRASLSGIDRTIADDTKAEIKNDSYGTTRTTVQKTATEKDGGKYLYINMPDEMVEAGSTQVRRIVSNGGVQVTITYRASNATTLIPASAVRNEGENQNYVYLVEQSYGGFMSSNTMKVAKTSVTVLERSDTYVSVAEDFNYQQIADREDRALTDGQTVMEYVD